MKDGGAKIGKTKIKDAAISLAALDGEARNAALSRIAENLLANAGRIDEANAVDVKNAEDAGVSAPLIKRLRMNAAKVTSVTEGIRGLIALPDPVGEEQLRAELADGLTLRKVSCPIGVIGVIFESRPDALVQIACLCLKSGNAVILKGGSEAAGTNRLLSELIREAAANTAEDAREKAIPPEWITQLETRAEIKEILGMDDTIDLLIPRGSNEFVRYIMDNTKIPVLGHADGICHCYVDGEAELPLAARVVVDSKTQYAAVCNAVETLLVHESCAADFLPMLREAFDSQSVARVALRGCERTREILAGYPVEPATEDDWRAEYLDYILAVKVVPDIDAAIAHINRYGSRHTEAIITRDGDAARRFMTYVDAANVFHNCSTRFADGFRYGFGAEVGISTGKIHARGPVGLSGLVTSKYLLTGHGDVVADFENGTRQFKHSTL